MGYFSNGSEGDSYHAALCQRCAHGPDNFKDDGCVVWMLHLIHNYDECNNPNSMLHVLIPRSKDGIRNERCAMFLPNGDKDEVEDE